MIRKLKLHKNYRHGSDPVVRSNGHWDDIKTDHYDVGDHRQGVVTAHQGPQQDAIRAERQQRLRGDSESRKD